MKKTIYFDLGNVLCFFDYAKMVHQIAACTNLQASHVKKILLEDGLLKQYESGEIDTQTLYQTFLDLSPKPFSLATFVEAFSDIFSPNTEIWPIVETLKKQGIQLILISNTNESHYHWIDTHYPILKFFNDKILSFKVKCLKPNPQIFQESLSLATGQLKECFYIDDIQEYVDSARKIGLDSEVYTDTETLQIHLDQRLYRS
jgi:glucose-1-phosphatase